MNHRSPTRPSTRSPAQGEGKGLGLPTPLIGAAAVGLCSAAYVAMRVAAAERKHPPTGRFVSAQGARLHIVERGEGPPLVLIHGNSSMGMDWLLSPVARMAARSHRVIVPDRPGYGYSTRPRGRAWGPEEQADALAEALGKMGVGRAIVVGHSWGAMVAAALALNHPQMVRGLILEGGYLYPRPRADILMKAPDALPLVGDLLRTTLSPLVHVALWPALAKLLCAPGEVPEQMWRLPPWLLFRPRALRAAAQEFATILPSAGRLAKRYAEIDQPLGIIGGRGDTFVSMKHHSVRLAHEMPQATFRSIEGAGHMSHHQAPEAMMEMIATIDRQSR